MEDKNHLLLSNQFRIILIMKLNQLLERENFYQILETTIKSNSFFDREKINHHNTNFNCYKYLNIIINNSLDKKLRKSLVFEYTLSKSFIKSILQKTYINFLFTPVLTDFFCDRVISLPLSLKKYAIVPGNHRIRLFTKDLKQSVLLLKHKESSKFIKNDTIVRKKYKLKYAPKIISYGPDWLIEEFIEGVPFNRLKSSQDLRFSSFISTHQDQLINTSKKVILKSQYFEMFNEEILNLIDFIDNIKLKNEISNFYRNIVDLFSNVNFNKIEISDTHGDFQQGNLRINNKNEIYLLDWEAADLRFYLYDFFVITSGIRTGNSIELSFKLFFEKLLNYKFNNDFEKNVLVLILCIEEFRYNLNEKISKNFYGNTMKFSVNEMKLFLKKL